VSAENPVSPKGDRVDGRSGGRSCGEHPNYLAPRGDPVGRILLGCGRLGHGRRSSNPGVQRDRARSSCCSRSDRRLEGQRSPSGHDLAARETGGAQGPLGDGFPVWRARARNQVVRRC